MISLQEAHTLLLKLAYQWFTHHSLEENIEINQAIDKILSQDIFSSSPFPPFDKSLVDGYACRRADIEKRLTVVESVMAGGPTQKVVQKNEAIKIMTGGVMPQGADIVLMREMVHSPTPQEIEYVGPNSSPKNWITQGEEVPLGSLLLKKGTLLAPQHIALLATSGVTSVPCFRPPKISYFMTGNEVIPPDKTPKWGQIRDSNGPQLKAQLMRMGMSAKDWGIIPDESQALTETFQMALQESDLIITSGGVSMGDLDLLPEIILKEGWEVHFNRIKIKPGKPTLLATHKKGAFFIGLPGNPVASFVIFEFLVKPFIYQLMGHHYNPHSTQLVLTETIGRKDLEREEYFPVLIEDGNRAIPIRYHGSSHLAALHMAQAFISMNVGENELKAGSVVYARLL